MKKSLLTVLIAAACIAKATSIYSQNKSKPAQRTRDTISVSGITTTFRAVLPVGYGNPKTDSTLFSTEFGQTLMRAAIAENKQGACMIGFYDFFSEYFTGKSEADALDSLQRQILGNMQGKILRQYKMILTSKKAKRTTEGERIKEDLPLQSRTTYFTSTNGKKTMYWRFALILDRPRIYQIAVTAPDKRSLDKPEIHSFFDSIRIIDSE